MPPACQWIYNLSECKVIKFLSGRAQVFIFPEYALGTLRKTYAGIYFIFNCFLIISFNSGEVGGGAATETIRP